MILLVIIATCFVVTNPVVTATRQDLIDGIKRLNADVIELRNEIESSISTRCDSISGCYGSSYDECQSEYTNKQQCPSGEDLGYAISDCGAGKRCNGVFDYSITTVRLPSNLATGPNGNPRNHQVVEAICYTRTAERWMVQKYNTDKRFWKSIGVSSPQMYFGSSTGVFRIFPARHSRECGQYDPRVRPWYQASVPSTISNTVKPRNVVVLMDTSRSMNETMNKKTGQTKLSYMKEAVISTVSSLSEKASIAVVRFGEHASLVGREGSLPPFHWRQATADHKARMIKDILKIDVRGRSNKIAGFNLAFNVIKNSLRDIKAKDNSTCELENIALLFFSDGGFNMPAVITDEEMVDFVSSDVKEVEGMGDYHMHTFLYTLGNTNVDQVSKKIACDSIVDGYWTPVTSAITPGNLTNGYQQLFSTPMGTPMFRNYTSWSAPYNFSSSGELGYTVSGLVYNRDVEPPRFMGAVGMDISAEAARHIYGGESVTMEETVRAMDEIINNIKETEFRATCEEQRINLTYCETQSMRHLSGGNAAICLPPKVDLTTEEVKDVLPVIDGDIILNITDQNVTANITGGELLDPTGEDVSPTEDEKGEALFEDVLNCSKGFLSPCPGYDEYPDNMWENVDLQGKSYQARVCCEVGTVGKNIVTDECPKLDEVRDTKLSDSAIFGIIFASLAVVEVFGCYFCFYYRKRRNSAMQ